MDLLSPNLHALRNFVESRLRSRGNADAEDIVQRILLRAFAYRDQFRFHSAFKTWLWTIAINEVRMFYRASRPVVSLDELPHVEFPDRGPSPLAAYEQVERQRWLEASVSRLPERDRGVIRLCLDDLSIAEIADDLAITRAAAKSNIFRARKRLARALRSRSKAAAPSAFQPLMQDRIAEAH